MVSAAYESSQILVAGLLIAIPLGIVLGILMGRFQIFEYAVDTYVFALYATPVVALAFPIAMVLGVDFVGKTTIVVFFAIMPIIVNVYHGVRNVDLSLLEVTRSFCSTEGAEVAGPESSRAWFRISSRGWVSRAVAPWWGWVVAEFSDEHVRGSAR